MMRMGVANEDETVTYIVWCDLNEMIEKQEKNSEEPTREEDINDTVMTQDDGERER